MSFFKVVLLLPSVWLFNVSFMSTNPPPNKSERVQAPLYERICPTLVPLLIRWTATIPCIAELATMLAARYSSEVSSEVISRLVLPGHQFPSTHLNAPFLAGSFLIATGGIGRLWCFRTLGRHFTYELTMRKDHVLVTAGPYSIVRHPSYLSAMLVMLGMIIVLTSPGSFLQRCGWLSGTRLGTSVAGAWMMQNMLVWLYFVVRCRREDAYLQERFRGKWDSYAERVRYRIIPGMY